MPDLIAKKNEDWERLAKRAGITISPHQLARLNGFSQLNPGQTVKLPKRGQETGAQASYTDIFRVPGQAPQAVQSQGPTQGAPLPNTVPQTPPPVGSQEWKLQMMEPQKLKPKRGVDPNPESYKRQINNFSFANAYADSITNPGRPAQPDQQINQQSGPYTDIFRVDGGPPQSFTSSGPDGMDNRDGQMYVDTVRIPGQGPQSLQSLGPTPTGPVNPSGTFSDTSIQLWDDYFNNPQVLSTNAIYAIDQKLKDPESGYVVAYHDALMDVLANQQDVYGNFNRVPIPAAMLDSLDIGYLDPNWYGQYHDLMVEYGFSEEEISAYWLASIGYEFSDTGTYMEFRGGEGALDLGGGSIGGSGSGSSGASGSGGYSGYGGYGGSPAGYANFSSGVRGLVNWRGNSYA
ncbi:hypothetical protein KQH61_06005 [bacterium]|nr:hypothetical protein [bacterium]